MGGPWARAAWASYLPRPGYTQSFRKTTRTSHAPAEATLGEVRAPSLVVMGERDPDFRDPAAEARWLSEHLKAEVVMVPGAGHFPQAEYPEVVNPAMLAFVSQVYKGA